MSVYSYPAALIADVGEIRCGQGVGFDRGEGIETGQIVCHRAMRHSKLTPEQT